jgi:hypothetical protein
MIKKILKFFSKTPAEESDLKPRGIKSTCDLGAKKIRSSRFIGKGY